MTEPRSDGMADDAVDLARVLYADPALQFLPYSAKGKGRSVEAWYNCMSLAELKALPIASMAARDSLLLLWSPGCHLHQAFELIAAWGFAPSTMGSPGSRRPRTARSCGWVAATRRAAAPSSVCWPSAVRESGVCGVTSRT